MKGQFISWISNLISWRLRFRIDCMQMKKVRNKVFRHNFRIVKFCFSLSSLGLVTQAKILAIHSHFG
jgi:hypothetical protein